MVLNSWVFSRLPGRDYLWQPSKPQLPFDLLVWLESLPPVLVGARRSSDSPRIIFRFFKDSVVYEGVACLAETKDEFGRQTAEVRIEEGNGSRRAMMRSYDAPSKEIFALKSATYSKHGSAIVADSLQHLRERGLSLYFGPEASFPTAFVPAVAVTEAGANMEFLAEIDSRNSRDFGINALGTDSLLTNSATKGMVGRFVGDTLRAFSGGSATGSRLSNNVLLALKRKSLSHAELEINGKIVGVLNERETRQLIKVIEALIQESNTGALSKDY